MASYTTNNMSPNAIFLINPRDFWEVDMELALQFVEALASAELSEMLELLDSDKLDKPELSELG